MSRGRWKREHELPSFPFHCSSAEQRSALPAGGRSRLRKPWPGPGYRVWRGRRSRRSCSVHRELMGCKAPACRDGAPSCTEHCGCRLAAPPGRLHPRSPRPRLPRTHRGRSPWHVSRAGNSGDPRRSSNPGVGRYHRHTGRRPHGGSAVGGPQTSKDAGERPLSPGGHMVRRTCGPRRPHTEVEPRRLLVSSPAPDGLAGSQGRRSRP